MLTSLEVQQEFQQCGSVLHALDMGMLRCLLLLVQGQGEALERETRELLSQVQAADSPSYEGEVRFFQALACGQSPNLATLEWLATRLEVSPVAARRARVLLGGEAALDRLDRRLLDGLQSLGGFGRLLSLQGHRKIPAHLGHCQSEVGGAKWAGRETVWRGREDHGPSPYRYFNCLCK
ncbi:MAG: hypothetical protein ACKO6N_11240 [Myxococcota bacterium]